MFARYLVQATAQVLQLLLRFDAPADTTLAQFQRENPKLGSRDRLQIANASFAAVRFLPLVRHFEALEPSLLPEAKTKDQPSERLAILALALEAHGPLSLPVTAEQLQAVFQTALDNLPEPEQQTWLQACLQASRSFNEGTGGALQHNLPQWLAQALQAQYGSEAFVALSQALKQPAALDLRVNLLTHKRNSVVTELQAQGIDCTPTAYSPWGIRLQGKPSLRQNPLLLNGTVEVQDEGSQLLALLTGAKRGETVVDFCAGAGGKTLAIGAMMRNTGRLYALDNSAHRLDGLQPRLKRSGLSNVHTLVLQSETDERLSRLRSKADRVLVDAPCSGLGTLRRHPELAWRNKAATIDELQQTQMRILESAASLLKPGGTLVYATCSLLEEENEAVNRWFSTTFARDFTPLDWSATLKKHDLQALQTSDRPAEHALSANAMALLPHVHHSDGFYLAGWRRTR